MNPSRFLVAIALSILCCQPGPSAASAQSIPTAVVPLPNQDKTDARAFAVLFRRVSTFQLMAQAATSPTAPEAQVLHILQLRLKLGDFDTATLVRVAKAWNEAAGPLNVQVSAAVVQYHQSFPNGIAEPGQDVRPPIVLSQLQKQIDAMTLLQRDSLHNMLRDADFQQMQAEVRSMFGSTPTPTRSSKHETALGKAVQQ